MWTGVHAIHTGLWDNTNFAWINELSSEIPTIGHMLREQGYYTAFKGKWHLSAVPHREDALERYGFSDFQQWGEMFGAPLAGSAARWNRGFRDDRLAGNKRHATRTAVAARVQPRQSA